MKKLIWPAVVLAIGVVLTLSQTVHSQVAGAPRSAKEQLLQLKEANDKLLEQQKATLLKLDDVQKEADQLRILVRRT